VIGKTGNERRRKWRNRLRRSHPTIVMIIFLSMIPVGLLGQKNGTNDEDLNRAITLETVKDYAGAFELYMKYESVHPASQEAFSGMSRNAVRAGKMDGYRDLVLERFAEYPEKPAHREICHRVPVQIRPERGREIARGGMSEAVAE